MEGTEKTTSKATEMKTSKIDETSELVESEQLEARSGDQNGATVSHTGGAEKGDGPCGNGQGDGQGKAGRLADAATTGCEHVVEPVICAFFTCVCMYLVHIHHLHDALFQCSMDVRNAHTIAGLAAELDGRQEALEARQQIVAKATDDELTRAAADAADTESSQARRLHIHMFVHVHAHADAHAHAQAHAHAHSHAQHAAWRAHRIWLRESDCSRLHQHVSYRCTRYIPGTCMHVHVHAHAHVRVSACAIRSSASRHSRYFDPL